MQSLAIFMAEDAHLCTLKGNVRMNCNFYTMIASLFADNSHKNLSLPNSTDRENTESYIGRENVSLLVSV